MRLRHKKGAEEEIAQSKYCINVENFINAKMKLNTNLTNNAKCKNCSFGDNNKSTTILIAENSILSNENKENNESYTKNSSRENTMNIEHFGKNDDSAESNIINGKTIEISNISKEEKILINNINYLDLNKYFSNANEINLELGMGKGKFICEMAKTYQNINFIGIEKYATVVLKAICNYKQILENENIQNKNLYFMCADVENLPNIFMPHSINKIYLNFSDPWPKKRHENRRLTHSHFLSIYENLLIKNGILEFKTDNKNLFDFSLEEIKNSNFELLDYTYDLHNDEKLNKNNIMTEYEEKFSSKGNPICKLIAKI